MGELADVVGDDWAATLWGCAFETDTDEVAVVPAGKSLQVFEIVKDGTWYKVGGMGYIFHELLEPVEKELAE